MARPLLSFSVHNLQFSGMPITIFLVLIAVFCVFSIITFTCGSEKVKKLQKRESFHLSNKKLLSKLNSNISCKAHSMAKMIAWRRIKAEEEEEEEEKIDDSDQVVWKKTIIMGERCRPLDFSGKILYDAQGNLVPEFSHQNENDNKKASTLQLN